MFKCDCGLSVKDILNILSNSEKDFIFSYIDEFGNYVFTDNFIHDFELMLLMLPLNVTSEDGYLIDVSDIQSLYKEHFKSASCMSFFPIIADILCRRDKLGIFSKILACDNSMMWSTNKEKMLEAYYLYFVENKKNLFVRSDVRIDNYLGKQISFVAPKKNYNLLKCNVLPEEFWNFLSEEPYFGYRDIPRNIDGYREDYILGKDENSGV